MRVVSGLPSPTTDCASVRNLEPDIAVTRAPPISQPRDQASLEIADVLGHRTMAMVKRYSHLAEGHKAMVIARMARERGL